MQRMNLFNSLRLRPLVLSAALAVGLLHVVTAAQDRLPAMPGYQQYQKVSQESRDAVKPGALTVAWQDAKSFEYTRDGKRYRYDVAAKSATEVGSVPVAEPAGGRGRGGRGGGPARGRQFESAESPDTKLRAVYRDRNLYVVDVASNAEVAVTTDGSEKDRTKNGTGSWVYGEELGQRTAMWWSPDSRKLAYYRFDESKVPDYFLQLKQTQLQSVVDTEAYPKAGADNPIVELFVYDVATKKSTRVDVRTGKPFSNDVVGHYVYRVSWSRDGRELLFNRTNRRQNILEFTAADPDTGATRVIIREEWPTGWVENSPAITFLNDGRRFIWESERNGWNNLYLYDLSGKLITPLTTHTAFEVGGPIKLDEQANVLFYTARSGDNHLKMQLHRVGLDGKKDVRLTDPAYHHVVGGCMGGPAGAPVAAPATTASPCGIAPDNRHFVDVYQTHDAPPATRLVDATSGKVVAELAQSDLTKFTALGLKKVEMFTYKAADGQTTLRGLLHFPSNFDPAKKYPVLVPVYGGPASGGNTARETFVTPSAITEYRLSRAQPRLARSAGDGEAHARFDLFEARAGRNGRHGRRREVAVVASLLRQDARGDLWHLVRRLFGGHVAAAVSRRLRGGVGLLGRDRVEPLRQHLHRALHVDPAGEQGGLRGRERDEVRERSERPPAHLLRDGGQQRPSLELDAVDRRADESGQELRRPGRPGSWPQRRQPVPDDGVLSRAPGRQGASDVFDALSRRLSGPCGPGRA